MINGWLQMPIVSEVVGIKMGPLTIDMQHGAIDYSNALQMLQSISTTETVPLAR